MPYVSHGYWVGPGEPTQPEPPRARCGGPGLCPVCGPEAFAIDPSLCVRVLAGPQRRRYATRDELVELLAADSHEGYVAGKRASGSTSRLTESGEEVLVPYEQLSESSKNISRAAARSILDGLANRGVDVDALVKITVRED